MYERGIEPFTVRTLWAFSPLGYIVVGRNDEYAIELRIPGGKVRLTRDIAASAVNSEEHREWDAFREYTVPVDGELASIVVPEQKPFFRELFAGRDGRIWVLRYVSAEKRGDVEPIPARPDRPLLTWREPVTYDVFEPTGAFLGTIEFPEEFRIQEAHGAVVWGTTMDDAGVERVVRFRVSFGDEAG
jgi:hypothetical protein